MTTSQLKAKYAEVFAEATHANNRTWLVKRIAWRLQALAGGDLSERARQRAAELAIDADLRVTAPRQQMVVAPERTTTRHVRFTDDNRLPPPGTIITRRYKGEMLQVKVLADGFEYAGERFKSLSAVAKHITGSHCNGILFFRLNKQEVANEE
jgi:hypothetical protein